MKTNKLVILTAALTLMAGANAAFAKESQSLPSQSSQSSQSRQSNPEETKEIPDGGATAALVGLGFGAVALVNRWNKKNK